MSKNRREKRKLARLSKNPNYIKPYNYKVRQHNGKIREFKLKDRKIELGLTLGIIITTLVWISMIYTK
jgi:hypothetical protein